MQMQYEQNKLFTKTMEEQSAMSKNISHQLDNLKSEIHGLQVKISNAKTYISSLSKA
jgi:phage host-nuclease inhibitor protein Gam